MQDTAGEVRANVLRYTPSQRRPTRTYQQQLSTDTGGSLEDMPEAMDDRAK